MRKFFLMLMALGVSFAMVAGDKLSARTQVFLQKRANSAQQLNKTKVKRIEPDTIPSSIL